MKECLSGDGSGLLEDDYTMAEQNVYHEVMMGVDRDKAEDIFDARIMIRPKLDPAFRHLKKFCP